jgi:hypothetical protein
MKRTTLQWLVFIFLPLSSGAETVTNDANKAREELFACYRSVFAQALRFRPELGTLPATLPRDLCEGKSGKGCPILLVPGRSEPTGLGAENRGVPGYFVITTTGTEFLRPSQDKSPHRFRLKNGAYVTVEPGKDPCREPIQSASASNAPAKGLERQAYLPSVKKGDKATPFDDKKAIFSLAMALHVAIDELVNPLLGLEKVIITPDAIDQLHAELKKACFDSQSDASYAIRVNASQVKLFARANRPVPGLVVMPGGFPVVVPGMGPNGAPIPGTTTPGTQAPPGLFPPPGSKSPPVIFPPPGAIRQPSGVPQPGSKPPMDGIN